MSTYFSKSRKESKKPHEQQIDVMGLLSRLYKKLDDVSNSRDPLKHPSANPGKQNCRQDNDREDPDLSEWIQSKVTERYLDENQMDQIDSK